MDYGFVSKVAPYLAIKPEMLGKGWVMPAPEAGLDPPENLYRADGSLYNYMQSEGGPREFYVPEGETAYASPPNVRSAAPVAPASRAPATRANDALRGLLPLVDEQSQAPVPRGTPTQSGRQIVRNPGRGNRSTIPPYRPRPVEVPRVPKQEETQGGWPTIGALLGRLGISLPVASSNGAQPGLVYTDEDGVVAPEQFDPRTGAGDYMQATAQQAARRQRESGARPANQAARDRILRP